MIPQTDIPNPWYKPFKPSDLKIFPTQSSNPLNYLDSAPLPISAASLVRAKSNGYTNNNEEAPAAPPLAKFPTKNLKGLVFGLYGQRYFL